MTELPVNRPVPELRMTGDGSHTLYDPFSGDHYHSVFGAVTESRHIFIHAGLHEAMQTHSRLRILEIGFGTGLNAFLSFIESLKLKISIMYTAIESRALSEEIILKLNYPGILDLRDGKKIFQNIHSSPWNEWIDVSPHFHLFKINSSLDVYEPRASTFDLVYFDAFGPDVQPEMWTQEVFCKMAQCLDDQGILVTYSTKGTVKRNLKNASFSIEKLPGPPGKRDILRARKQ